MLGDSTTAKACLTDAQIEKEIKSVIASHKLPKGIGNQYFLFTPQGIASCTKSNTLSSGGCYNPLQFYGFCAYHSHIGSGARAVLYANMPYSAVAGLPVGSVAERQRRDRLRAEQREPRTQRHDHRSTRDRLVRQQRRRDRRRPSATSRSDHPLARPPPASTTR